MDTPTNTAMLLIQAGIVIGTFLLAHAYVTRHTARPAAVAGFKGFLSGSG